MSHIACRSVWKAVVVFAFMAFAFGLNASASSASNVQALKVSKSGSRAGLTAERLATAHESAVSQTFWTAMSPQSNLALLATAAKVGRHNASAPLRLTVGLKLRHVEDLKVFLRNVQDPRSPQYHKFLTPAEFTAKYGPSEAQVKAVKGFLEEKGIQVVDVSPNHILIHTKAKTGIYEHAFGISINDYILNNRSFVSTEDRPKIPRPLSPVVQGVIGLNNVVQMQSLRHVKPFGGRNMVKPHKGAPPPASSGYYNPLQIANAYEWPSITDSNNGKGVTVAILTANSSGLPAGNYTAFWETFGLPVHEVNVIPVGGDDGNTDGTGETLLDIEWSGAMAPGAAFNVYVAADTSFETFTDMFNQFVSDNTAQVMSISWGAPEYCGTDKLCNPSITTDNEIFMQAAAQGISMFAAAGDDGSSSCGSNVCPPGDDNANFPSSSPYVTAANGTELFADINGNYGHEIAWKGTGGATSRVFEQPDWQVGPGVPDNGWRSNSDIAMNAGQARPYLAFMEGQLKQVWGTSVVSPQLAGLFAIAISQHDGTSLGQSNKLLYDDVNADNYLTDFRDVTEGNNGAYEATSNWDHPTGWGSPRAKNLLAHIGVQGPRGKLVGTVTDAESGVPIKDAKVTMTPRRYVSMTQDDGTYSHILPVGTYTVTVTDFGYDPATATVTIRDGANTKRDFTLSQARTVEISGRVSDGSGHGYGLYSEIRVKTSAFGVVGDLWTDPTTGKYSVTLPVGYDYDFAVTPSFNGYQTVSEKLSIDEDANDLTHDFSVPVAAACKAPGYGFVKGFSEDFNGAWPPHGWIVENNTDHAAIEWNSNTAQGYDNWTGGTGDAAMASDKSGHAYTAHYDASLITPKIPVDSLPSGAALKYKANFLRSADGVLDLDMSVDGGNFINLLHWSGNHGERMRLPGVDVGVDLASHIPPGATDIQLRWRSHAVNGRGFSKYAQIDDVVIGNCLPVSGGLVFGQVKDANTGKGIVGALVEDNQGNRIRTIDNPNDPNLSSGAYLFFLPSGERVVTASRVNYADASATVTVADNAVKTQNFELEAGRLDSSPDQFDLQVTVGSQKNVKLNLNNSGSSAAHYIVRSINASPPETVSQAMGPFAAPTHYDGHENLNAPSPRTIKTHPIKGKLPGQMKSYQALAAGDVIAKFAAGLQIYGLGVDHNTGSLWLGSPLTMDGDDADHRFLFDGTDTGDSINVSNRQVQYMADMAFDDNTGMLWQLSVGSGAAGGVSFIWELDPRTMEATGKKIMVPSPQSERGLAYDPVTNTWYAGDFFSNSIYHFNAEGKLLDSVNVGFPVQGLAYNSSTGHLFVLGTYGQYTVAVLDVSDNYVPIDAFNVPGFDNGMAGAGFGYDCNGNLWLDDYKNSVVWEVISGETGWCDNKVIPWLTVAPEAGTLAAGASSVVELTFDGSGKEAFSTSKAYLKIMGDTPYLPKVVPLTVTWEARPVNLVLTGKASPTVARKGDNLVYTLNVENRQEEGHGAATETTLSYELPPGVNYISGSGEGVDCTAPLAGSSSTPKIAKDTSGRVVCHLGVLTQQASKTVSIAVQANSAGMLDGRFEASSREPNDSDQSTLDIATTVIGTADVSASASSAMIDEGGSGSIQLVVSNAGPDPATGVQLKVSSGASVKLTDVTSSAGSCTASGSDGYSCDIGEIAAGGKAEVTLSAFGAYAGTAMVQGQALTSADDPDQANNVTTSTVTVKAANNGGGDSDSGGGSLGWLALAVLLGLALAGAGLKDRGEMD